MPDDARRTEALELMLGRFPAVAERVERVYGLRLPRHVAVFAALWASAQHDEGETSALYDLGIAPWGVADYFRDGGLDRTGKDGLDERLHARFRCDPAGFVTVSSGNSDGLHYGLYYDDPAQFPMFIAHNYARDSAETWATGNLTMVQELRSVLDSAFSDYPGEEEETAGLQPLVEAVEWFADADREYSDGADLPRLPRPGGTIAIFPLLPPGSGDARERQAADRLTALRTVNPQADAWIAQARAELADGRPAYALAIGMETHWLDLDAYREIGLELLTGAYRTLGRDALAEIAAVHAAHRDLTSVEVLTA